MLRYLVHLENGVRVNAQSIACVRRAVWGMLYADDACIVFKSAEGLAQMVTIIVTVFEAKVSRYLRRTRGQCYYRH